jgi:hypothetical protein
MGRDIKDRYFQGRVMVHRGHQSMSLATITSTSRASWD